MSQVFSHRIENFDSLDISKLKTSAWHFYLIKYGTQINGEALTFPVAVIAGAGNGPRISIVSGIHGDEFEGVCALWKLIQQNNFPIKKGTLFVIPVANCPAYEAGTRESPIDGINLARVFPGDVKGLPSERLAYVLYHQILLSCDLVIDLHSGGRALLFLPLAGFYNVPGEAGNMSFNTAKATGWKYLWSAPKRDGVLSYEVIKRGIPAVGAEIAGAGRCLKNDVDNYLNAIYNILGRYGLIQLEASEVNENSQIIIEGDWYICNHSGFFETTAILGQSIRQGQLLGRIYNIFGQAVDDIFARHDGIVAGTRAFPTIKAGEWSIFIGRPNLEAGYGQEEIP